MKSGKSALSGHSHPWTLIALLLPALIAALGASIANVALPALAHAFSAKFTEAQAVVIAYLATLTVTVVFAGGLADKCGLRRALVFGLGLFMAASFCCAIAPRLSALVASRALQGVGAGFLMTISMALMREHAEDRKAGRAMGLLGTVSAAGTALGPSMSGLLVPVVASSRTIWAAASCSPELANGGSGNAESCRFLRRLAGRAFLLLIVRPDR